MYLVPGTTDNAVSFRISYIFAISALAPQLTTQEREFAIYQILLGWKNAPGTRYFLYKRTKDVSCEYDRLNG